MMLPPGRILGADYFARPSDTVGRDLIGKLLWAEGVGGGRLTEVEAYLPEGDPACHAACGRTRRNDPMFGPPGSIYVYRSYGVHVLLNLVCDQESVASAVLIRSFEPLGAVEHLRRNRGVDSEDGRQLSCGPGRVGQALGLHLGLNGLQLGETSGLFVLDDGERPEVAFTTRVGISRGEQLPLRYYMRGSRYVSRLVRVTKGGGDETSRDI